jgi:E3 ubiquitin-protein ligase RNF216
LEIFPDVEIAHANKLLQDFNNVPADVINALLENGSYPKQEKKPAPVAVVKLSGTAEPMYNYMSASSFEPTQEYIAQSVEALQREFGGFLTKAGAKFFMEKSDNHFAIAHEKILRALTGKDDATAGKASLGNLEDPDIAQYKKLKATTEGTAVVDDALKNRLKTVFSCSPHKNHFRKRRVKRKEGDDNLSNAILLDEAAFVKSKLSKWKDRVDTKIQLKLNRELALSEGTAMECACCYDKVAMEEIIQCKDGHLFCQECLSSYVESQVFSNQSFGKDPETKEEALELLCFHGDGCGSGFDRYFLEKALEPKVLQQYDELVAHKAVEKAGLGETIWYVYW